MPLPCSSPPSPTWLNLESSALILSKVQRITALLQIFSNVFSCSHLIRFVIIEVSQLTMERVQTIIPALQGLAFDAIFEIDMV